MLSDHGSQLICAGKELRELYEMIDWNTIYHFGVEEGLEWKLTKSADSPWENGSSEAMIKLVKRNLMLSIGTHILTFEEVHTILFEAANMLKKRPIETKTNNPEEGSYVQMIW